MFRDWAVNLGYYRRDISWIVYLILLILLFVFHFIFLKKIKQHSALRIACMIALFGCISYPFISHDLFNYLFDARIFTLYGQNPYIHTALDFQKDLWTRFMHWTHRTYPYGPTFLPLTLIPSFLGMGKFSLTFFLYKLMNGILYCLAVYCLSKMNKKAAMFFATNPLIIIEGIINTHNDLIAVSLGLIGIYYLGKEHAIWARILLVCSAGIKYITAPIVTLDSSLKSRRYIQLLFAAQIFLIFCACFKMTIQPWYFLSLFVFIPFFPDFFEILNILFFGLLIAYYPFIRLGEWTAKYVTLKLEIIAISLGVLVGYLVVDYLLRKKKFFTK